VEQIPGGCSVELPCDHDREERLHVRLGRVEADVAQRAVGQIPVRLGVHVARPGRPSGFGAKVLVVCLPIAIAAAKVVLMDGLVVLDQLAPHAAMLVGHGERTRCAGSVGEEDTFVVLAVDVGVGDADPALCLHDRLVQRLMPRPPVLLVCRGSRRRGIAECLTSTDDLSDPPVLEVR
jgi:hypothetical protein